MSEDMCAGNFLLQIVCGCELGSEKRRTPAFRLARLSVNGRGGGNGRSLRAETPSTMMTYPIEIERRDLEDIAKRTSVHACNSVYVCGCTCTRARCTCTRARCDARGVQTSSKLPARAHHSRHHASARHSSASTKTDCQAPCHTPTTTLRLCHTAVLALHCRPPANHQVQNRMWVIARSYFHPSPPIVS